MRFAQPQLEIAANEPAVGRRCQDRMELEIGKTGNAQPQGIKELLEARQRHSPTKHMEEYRHQCRRTGPRSVIQSVIWRLVTALYCVPVQTSRAILRLGSAFVPPKGEILGA